MSQSLERFVEFLLVHVKPQCILGERQPSETGRSVHRVYYHASLAFSYRHMKQYQGDYLDVNDRMKPPGHAADLLSQDYWKGVGWCSGC